MDYTDLRTMLLDRLVELEPNLHLSGPDRGVYKLADEDLRNYICWLHNGDNEYDIVAGAGLSEEEAKEFVNMWTGQWWKKYKQRTKLVLTDNEFQKFTNTMKGSSSLKAEYLLSQETLNEMRREIIRVLLNSGEICGTEVVANNLIIKEFRDRDFKKELKVEEVVNVIVSLKRRAQQLAQTTGAFIFILPDKSKIREFRNDGEVNAK